MKEQIYILIEVQKIETEAGKIKAEIDRVPEKLACLDEKLEKSEKKIKEKEAALDDFKKKYRALESDVQINLDIIKKNQAKLSIVKTNKEYQALLKGIEELKKKNSLMEDEMLGLLDLMEEAEKELTLGKSEHKAFEQRIFAEKNTIKKETETDEKKLARLVKEREKLIKSVKPDMLDVYEDVKRQVSAPVMARVTGTVCNGCNMNIPPQMRNELQRFDTLKYCPFCHRIIYWEAQEPKPEKTK